MAGSSVELPSYSTLGEFEKLVSDIDSGAIKTVILDQCNPVYDMPQLKGLDKALGKANTIAIALIATNLPLKQTLYFLSLIILKAGLMQLALVLTQFLNL